jgi:hypothetical protein
MIERVTSMWFPKDCEHTVYKIKKTHGGLGDLAQLLSTLVLEDLEIVGQQAFTLLELNTEIFLSYPGLGNKRRSLSGER